MKAGTVPGLEVCSVGCLKKGGVVKQIVEYVFCCWDLCREFLKFTRFIAAKISNIKTSAIFNTQ